MKIGPIEIIWNDRGETPRSVPETGALPMKSVELANTFAVADTMTWWRALLQVIDQHENQANRGAQEAAGGNNELCAHCASGAQHIRMLREEFVRLREQGIKGRGEQETSNAQRPTLNVQ